MFGFGHGVLVVGKGIDLFRIEEVPGEGIVVGAKSQDEEEGGDDEEEPDSDPIEGHSLIVIKYDI